MVFLSNMRKGKEVLGCSWEKDLVKHQETLGKYLESYIGKKQQLLKLGKIIV